MYKLVISDDEGKTTIVPLIRDEITIGRKEGNTIRLTERNVSRFHARVIRKDDGFLIEDLGSLCGTKVNSDLLRSSSTQITTGDKVTIGDYSLSIRTDVGADVPMGKQIGPDDEAGIGKVSPYSRLVILNGAQAGRDVELKGELYVLGRSEEANFRIKDRSVSRAHARIDLDAGKWTISDLDSINGILINDEKKDDYMLKAGDVIELGTIRLRFVAPGEPYEYEPSSEAETVHSSPEPESLSKSPPKKIVLFLGVIALLAMVSILVSIALHNENRTPEDTSSPPSEESLSYQQLMEKGKDAMQAEQWRAAARLFALAQQKEQGSQAAREMKNIAIEESDSQQAFAAGLKARKNGDWREALDRFRKIPQSSHYFDSKQLTEVAGKLCEELLETAKLLINNKDYNDVDEIVKKIGNLVEAPKKCHRRSERLWKQFLATKPALDPETDTGEKRTPKKPSGRKFERVARKAKTSSKKKDTLTNPYDDQTTNARLGLVQAANDLAKEEASTGGSPVERARALADKGDVKGAIAILERAGNSRQVLVLLASLYKKTGNRAGYERVARAFVDRYPNDPAVKEFKRNL